MPERRKPVEQREVIEVDGVNQRLSWIAENRPEILIKRICDGPGNADAYFSALSKAGLGRGELEKMIINHPEWGINVNVFTQQ